MKESAYSDREQQGIEGLLEIGTESIPCLLSFCEAQQERSPLE